MNYFNLSTPQKNIWNLQVFHEGTAISNLCGAVLFQEGREIKMLERAINVVLQKQTALRLQFAKINGEIKQYIKEYSYENIPTHKFSDALELETYANELAKKPLDILKNDMYQFEIICVGEQTGILVVFSHLISDAWTFSLLVSEVDFIYKKLEEDIAPETESADYTKYVLAEQEYFRSARYEADKLFWQEKYTSAPKKTTMKPELKGADSIVVKRV